MEEKLDTLIEQNAQILILLNILVQRMEENTANAFNSKTRLDAIEGNAYEIKSRLEFMSPNYVPPENSSSSEDAADNNIEMLDLINSNVVSIADNNLHTMNENIVYMARTLDSMQQTIDSMHNYVRSIKYDVGGIL